MCRETKSVMSMVWSSTSYSQAPKVGIERAEEPQDETTIEGSTHFMTLPASAAMRPYSVAVFLQICQGPSISFPRHQNLTPGGSLKPWDARRSLRLVRP